MLKYRHFTEKLMVIMILENKKRENMNGTLILHSIDSAMEIKKF
jgi:hypothetical protein